ncbi:MAG: hypothetical protein L0154_23285 [Chloroflexi bacterium]|nr:hypothetical protein [Chloroflexota bacterium]
MESYPNQPPLNSPQCKFVWIEVFQSGQHNPALLEWIVTLIGFLIHEASAGDDYLVRFTMTGAGVIIEGVVAMERLSKQVK